MKVIILNSGLGKRMGEYTTHLPKCLVELNHTETILSRQLRMLEKTGINRVIMTTGPYHLIQKEYIDRLALKLDITLVNNYHYATTNYIYSIYLARDYLEDDILLLHGDMVFEEKVLQLLLNSTVSSMAVSTLFPLPEKDFKAVIRDGKVEAVGIEFFESAVAAQPMYLLKKKDWIVWLEKICDYCQSGQTACYAENAFNKVSHKMKLYPLDMKNLLCQEVDTIADLLEVQSRLKEIG